MESGKQTILLIDKKKLEVSGVKNVIAFDEGYLELDTELGVLCIGGEGMRVESLNHENGKITVTGTVLELGYKEKRTKKRLFSL